MKRARLAVVAVLSVVALHASARPRVAVALETRTWRVGDVERQGLVAAPASSGDPVPLVIVFHGHGGSSANISRTFGIHATWPAALVVYPQGLPTAGVLTDREGKLAGWQSVAGEQGDRDLKLFDAIVAWATSSYDVDSRRIFVAGHSNGGSMTYVLWATRATRLAAVAPAASVFGRNLTAARPLPALIIAGRQDPLVPIASQERSIAAALALDHADAKGTAWFGGAMLHPSSIGADVVTYIHPGAHALPPDAAAMVATFFKGRKKA